jgi:hypothetical protein
MFLYRKFFGARGTHPVGVREKHNKSEACSFGEVLIDNFLIKLGIFPTKTFTPCLSESSNYTETNFSLNLIPGIILFKTTSLLSLHQIQILSLIEADFSISE